MSLCRFYPTPSDRMAIIWSLTPIKDAVVLEYGPAGTTHFGAGLYGSFGIELKNSLYTTHISEDDIIMGDVSRLENAILEIDKTYHPKIIFVVASAVIAVIGTDIAGVCQYMQEQVDARLISFEEGGFRGDYTYGLKSVYRMLAREVIEPAPKKEKTYAILGASAGAYRIRSDVWEIKELMREAFGWECHFTMGLECTSQEIKEAGSVCLNIVLRNEATEAAELIEKKCGVPYYYGAPYGYKGTLEWLKAISKMIGEEINSKLVERLEKKIMYLTPMGGPMAMLGKIQYPASIQGDYDTLIGFSSAVEEMDFEVENFICSHSLKDIACKNERICYLPKEKDRIRLFQSLQGQWCLGSEEMERYAHEDNYVTIISAPFVSKTQTAMHMPFMGEKGMDYLLELKNLYISKINIK